MANIEQHVGQNLPERLQYLDSISLK